MKKFIVRRETVCSQVVYAKSAAEAEAIVIDMEADDNRWVHQDTSFDAEETL